MDNKSDSDSSDLQNDNTSTANDNAESQPPAQPQVIQPTVINPTNNTKENPLPQVPIEIKPVQPNDVAQNSDKSNQSSAVTSDKPPESQGKTVSSEPDPATVQNDTPTTQQATSQQTKPTVAVPPTTVQQTQPQQPVQPSNTVAPPTPNTTSTTPSLKNNSNVTPPVLPGSTNKKSKFPKHKLAALVLILVLVMAGGAFGFVKYLENTPKNVWARGMASVGVGLKEVADRSFKRDLTNTNYKGNFIMEKPLALSADLEGNYALSGNGALKLTVNSQDFSPTFESRYFKQDKKIPVYYLKYTGITSIIESLVGPGYSSQVLSSLKSYLPAEGQWWKLDLNELVDQGLIPSDLLDTSSSSQITQEDMAKVAQAVLDATNTYVFTKNSSDMVLQYSDVLGKEDFEGVRSQKYKVQVNTDNLKRYITAIRDNIEASGIRDKLGIKKPLSESYTDDDISKNVEQISKSLKNYNIEAWVALNTKVLRNIRISDAKPDKESDYYVDISILLKDNSTDIPVRVRVTGDDKTAKGFYELSTTLSTDTNNIKFAINADVSFVDNSASDVKFNSEVSFSGTAEAPKSTIPEGSGSLIDLINNLLGGYSSAQSSSKDVVRTVDINFIFQKLEEYYNENGYYPSSIDTTTLPGLDPGALSDPDGNFISNDIPATDNTLPLFPYRLDKPVGAQYTYSPYECNISGKICSKYSLSAWLEDGSRLRKESL